MKTIVLLAAAAGIASATPHGHGHFHQHKREANAIKVERSVATHLAFVLNGETITKDKVCEGIADGSLKWDSEPAMDACGIPSSISIPTPTPTPTPTPQAPKSSAAAGEFYAKPKPASSAPASPAVHQDFGAADLLGDVVNFVASLARDDYPDFEDGVHRCEDGPPTKYGAVPVKHLNKGGWTTIQQLNSAHNDIIQQSNKCSQDHDSCSYACAPGYQKLQWVKTQPASGASIGGLLCKGGFLYRANDNPKLCGRGAGGVSVKNKGGKKLCVCRTDYPADEAETVPVDVAVGDSQPLTNPIAENYYVHQSGPTSAQYYLNPFGIGSSQGCSWDGNGDGETGNEAPINFGVGNRGGTTWLSIMQNSPTTYQAYQGTVEIVGDISGSCKYENGQFCGDAGCQSVTDLGAGCTVSVPTGGKATFVVSH